MGTAESSSRWFQLMNGIVEKAVLISNQVLFSKDESL